MRLTLIAILLGLIVAPLAPAADADAHRPDPHSVVRGMTISCSGAGQVWGSDAMVETLRELKALGVNWVAIHPYASISADGTVGGGRTSRMYAETSWLTRPIREAHALGLKIMIKPHLAYWGSPFSWRGEITFDTDEEWARFFETYSTWITMVAELTADADAFAVGTELGGTVARESEWRAVIAGVRAKTAAPLTYSANWDRFEKVPFWDALDAIGIQSYFPLTDSDAVPEQADLDRAWRRLVRDLEAYGRAHRRPIVLAELGYNLSSDAARRPWDYRTGGPNADEVQRRCMQAALGALRGSETVTGAFLWKWFPGDRRRGNFLMQTPEMRDVIGLHWRSVAPDPPASARDGGLPSSGVATP